MKHISLIFLLFLNLNLFSQNIAGFKRTQNSFYIFDNGELHQVEHRPVKSFSEGNHYVAYINDANEFKMYRNGRTYFLEEGAFINEYKSSNHLMAIKKESQLSVWDNNRTHILSTRVNDYALTDSLVAYFDDLMKEYKVYYHNRVYTLENFVGQYPVKSHKTGKNTLAYIDRNNRFNIFYRGNKETIDRYNDTIRYEAGLDIVAYEAEDNYLFRIFYKGEIFEASKLKPVNFRTGDGLVAFIDASGEFKIYDHGILYTITKFKPDFYDVKDNLVIFSDTSNHFSVFASGRVHNLEVDQPKSYVAEDGNIAYIDHLGRLKIFTQGKSTLVSYERIKSYRLNGNVLIFDTGNGENVWFNENLY